MAGSEPASDPLIGRSLSHFRIVAKLGEGGMGVVYRATDERLRREVALKVLPEGLASDPERRRRFLREARAAAAVSHRNIATVLDIGEADGHVFIAMELVQGETLRARPVSETSTLFASPRPRSRPRRVPFGAPQTFRRPPPRPTNAAHTPPSPGPLEHARPRDTRRR